MPITYVGAGTAAAANNASVTPTLPGGLQVGDLLLCFASARGPGTLGTPSGWTQRWQLSHASSGVNKIALFWKVYAAGDGNPTVTYTGGGSNQTVIAQCCAFRGVKNSSPFDTQGSTSSNASQGNIGPISGITPAYNDACVLVFGHRADDWTSVDTLTGDGLTWNEIGEPDSTAGSDAGEVWDYAVISGAPVTITSKTLTVTGGAANTGMGVMDSLRAATAHALEGATSGLGAAVALLAGLCFLQGSALAQSAAIGATTATRACIGASVGGGTALGSLSAAQQLGGAAVGQGATLGAPSVVKTLGSTAVGQAATTGSLTGLQPLEGAAAGQGAAVGALAVALSLTGASTAQGEASGALARLLAAGGTATGQSTVVGSLLATRWLTGIAVAQGSTAGELTLVEGGQTHELTGRATGQGVTAGTLERLLAIEGAAAGQGEAAGTLARLLAVRGAASGQGLSTGLLAGLRVLAGITAGQGQVAGLLVGFEQLSDVAAMTRTFRVPAERRVIVPFEQRLFQVPADRRAMMVDS